MQAPLFLWLGMRSREELWLGISQGMHQIVVSFQINRETFLVYMGLQIITSHFAEEKDI